MADERTGVLVAGAGMAGCAAAMFLARRGVDVLLVERHRSTATHPRATGQSRRTMELLGYAGVADEITAAGDGNDDTRAVTPALFGTASQDQVEPILIRRAQQDGADVRFGVEVVELAQDAAGVTVRLLNHWNGRLTTVRADYVVAADGHRSRIRESLGIHRHGRGTLRNTIEVIYVRGDTHDRRLLSLEYHPERGESMRDFTTETVTDLIRRADPDADVDVEAVQAWQVCASVAENFAAGRVFLAGDAAATAPPNGGTSGDKAIGDAFDIAWKLAAVLDGTAAPALLDSYEAERAPYAEQVVLAALHTAKEHTMPWLDLTGDPTPLAELTLGFGFRCRSTAVLIDDTDPAPAEDPTQPSARPGFRAPHVPLRSGDTPVSTLDLFGTGWTLLTATGGGVWHEAARHAAATLGVAVKPVGLGGDLTDPTGTLAATYGIEHGGASLIRPDGVVAWRTDTEPADPAATLLAVLRRLLGLDQATAAA
ncbi:MAG TPA: FAD-dependent oxidoreductase [Pseudonocardiaceae bacterium]|nr:FAD-dependent oxidoreductase [Pseudonocardiaceae bacterium]